MLEEKKAGTGNETNNGNCNFYFLNFHRDQTVNVIYRSDRIQEPQILAKHLGSLSIIAPQKSFMSDMPFSVELLGRSCRCCRHRLVEENLKHFTQMGEIQYA